MTTIAERVQAGVSWLDETRPGWRDAINLDYLDLSDCDRCVCGQVFEAANPDLDWRSGYRIALNEVGFANMYQPEGIAWAYEHGFCSAATLAHGLAPSTIAKRYRDLAAEWRRVIHAARVREEVAA